MYYLKQIKKIISVTYQTITDALFPIECIGCGQEGEWLCPQCFDKIPIKTRQSCPSCGANNDYGTYCQRCQKNKYLDGVWVAGDYHHPLLVKLLKTFKYRFAHTIAPTLGKYLFFFINSLKNQNFIERYRCKTLLLPENAILIPVPLHRRRLKWRGFNQSYEILKEMNKFLDWNEDRENLIRIKYKKPQAKLKAKDRRENIQGSFAWRGAKLKKRNIILIDDITTTGSTLEECARILKQNGAKEVWGLVIAKN